MELLKNNRPLLNVFGNDRIAEIPYKKISEIVIYSFRS